jgi:diguanylate cyclase (GGDEF)-like protein
LIRLRRLRLGLLARVLLTLCAIAAFSTGLALLLQHRSLSADLRNAATVRLEGAAAAANRLAASHLMTVLERYDAISQTPEFRANLEIKDKNTLAYYANQVAEQQAASVVLFLEPNAELSVSSGDEALIPLAHEWLAASPLPFCDDWRARDTEQIHELAALGYPGFLHCEQPADSHYWGALIAEQGAAFAAAALPLRRGRELLGFLVALEPVKPELLEVWTELCGATVSLDTPRESGASRLELAVRSIGPLELRVTASLEAETEALARSRNQVLTAGAIALALAFAASSLLARGLLRPLREIKSAAERIGQGDLTTQLDLVRDDEFGDVARAFNLMIRHLHHTQGSLESAQRLAQLGNWVLDFETQEIQYSDEFARIYRIEEGLECFTHDALVAKIHPDDAAHFAAALESCRSNGTPFRLDHRMVGREGEERTLHSQGERSLSDKGAYQLEGTVQDITARKEVEEQIRYLAYHDSLTGLGNRRLFKERLDLALREAGTDGQMVAVMFLDIDNFKVINDTLGHSAGDELLKDVADRLVKCVRSSDVVASGSATVSRLGGDEFTVLLSDLQDTREIVGVAERILAALAEPFEVKGEDVGIGGSVGITVSPADGADVETLLRNSDTAMYHAKHKGRNNFQFYTESMKEAAFKRLTLENNLRRAIEREEFRVYYQPKLDLATGKVKGLEALVRWRDPTAGIVLPGEFIPLAEETGFIVLIGEWVLRAAAEHSTEWQRAGRDPMPISVNLSPMQIDEVGFADKLAGILEETGLDASLLELEITESTLMRDEVSAIALLHRLRNMGIRLSLDDFGTGYSSLSYLRRLPIDTLKIDSAFVKGIATDPEDAAFAGAIIAMAKVLQLRVVVEGVENEQQREVLEELGCDEIQGFLISAPVPAEEVAQMLSAAEAAEKPKRRRGALKRKAGASAP